MFARIPKKGPICKSWAYLRETAWGGKTYRAIFWEGTSYQRARPPKPVLQASEVGLVWFVPVSSKEHDRTLTKGGNVSWARGRGFQKPFLGRGVMVYFPLPLGYHFSLGNIPVTTTTKIFPKVLRYKWEAYCNTNGARTAIQMGGVLTVFPFPQSVGAPEVLQYKLETYCDTNWRCIVILF